MMSTDHGPERHRLARSFGPVAEAYDRGRPSFPADAARWLTRHSTWNAELEQRPDSRRERHRRPGKFSQLMTAFNMERLHNCAFNLGMASAAYDEAVAYTSRRQAFGRN